MIIDDKKSAIQKENAMQHRKYRNDCCQCLH